MGQFDKNAKGNDIHNSYTATEQRKKDGLMKQFTTWGLKDGPRGTTDAYREGWDRIFNKNKFKRDSGADRIFNKNKFKRDSGADRIFNKKKEVESDNDIHRTTRDTEEESSEEIQRDDTGPSRDG